MGELTLPPLLLCLRLSVSPSLHHTAYPQTWEIMSRFKYLIGEQQAGVPTVRHSSGTDRAELARRELELWGSANSYVGEQTRALGLSSPWGPEKRWDLLRLSPSYGHYA